MRGLTVGSGVLTAAQRTSVRDLYQKTGRPYETSIFLRGTQVGPHHQVVRPQPLCVSVT